MKKIQSNFKGFLYNLRRQNVKERKIEAENSRPGRKNSEINKLKMGPFQLEQNDHGDHGLFQNIFEPTVTQNNPK